MWISWMTKIGKGRRNLRAVGIVGHHTVWSVHEISMAKPFAPNAIVLVCGITCNPLFDSCQVSYQVMCQGCQAAWHKVDDMSSLAIECLK
jgi:hypothetical protein